MAYGTEYYKLMNAISQYYGAGSDQWVEIAKYGAASDQWATILKETPYVSTVEAADGSILSYSVPDFFGKAAESATGAINSNTQTALMESPSAFKIPANTTVDAVTGKVVAESGSVAATGGASVATVVGNIAFAAAAVMSGVKLGAAFDQALYNFDPDYWDSIGCRTLDPHTWDSICTTQGGKAAFNCLFGINQNTGETQAYIDQNLLAMVALYMNSKGSWNSDNIDIGDTPGLDFSNVPMPFSIGNQYMIASSLEPLVEHTFGITGATGTARMTCFYQSSFDQAHPDWDPLIHYNVYAASTDPFSAQGLSGSTQAQPRTILGRTIYCWFGIVAGTPTWNTAITYGTGNPLPDVFGNFTFPDEDTLYYILALGNEHQGTPGISIQPGATIPTGITPGMTASDVLALLQQQYPDLFTDAITQDVVQPDGSVKRYTYVPVPIPDSITQDEITEKLKPVGGTDLKQDQTTIDDTSPQNLIDTLIDLITSHDPYQVVDPGNPNGTDYPDTGTGETPTITPPTGSANALYSIYNPTQAQLNSFGAWLWSSDFVDQLLKVFNDPMQAIIGLHKVFATPPVSGTGPIKVGYLSSGVTSALVSNQYTSVDCGHINLKEYFGNVLDYTDTDIYIYLPFIGIVPLNVTDVMRADINVVYKVDVLTGACLANINVKRDLNAGGQLYTYAGNCAVQYPISSGSYMGIVTSALGIAGSIAGTVLSGGSMLPLALGAGASALSSAKTKVEHSGSLSGNAGAMGIKKPYLIVRRPQAVLARNYEKFYGISNNVYNTLSSYNGFVRVKYVHLENLSYATDNELLEIESLLKDGVMI